MHIFPLGRIVYMPLSSSTTTAPTLVGSMSTDFPSNPTIPVYNTALLNNPFSLCTPMKFEHNVLQPTLSYGYKRVRGDLHDTQRRKRSKFTSTIKNSDSFSSASKNALMRLYEVKPSVEYKLIAKTGPSHRPLFTMTVEVNGQVFEGTAQTKKEAKQAAAEKALQSISGLNESEPPPRINIDLNLLNTSLEDSDHIQQTTTSPNIVQPFDLLSQLKPDVQFEESVDDRTSEQHEFKFTVIIDNQRFIGTGDNKNLAKTKAAQFALEKVFGICPDNEGTQTLVKPSGFKIDNLSDSRHEFADRIALCIQEKFKLLTHNDIRLQRRKVLSGIVLTRDLNLESMEIICITTGTKCINGDRLKLNGQSLVDCHAEILSRRCLIRYCYEQLNLFMNGKSEQSIFEKIDTTNRFQLKPSVAFHLYVSTTPCGDSRLFSPQETSNQDWKNSLRKSRGLLRRKIEVGEGTIPISAKIIHTLLTNERLSTMSCSDKLCRWNFIGLQGALLSTLIDPIYYTSIIIGGLYHSEHIQRALFDRIEHTMDHISTPYGLRRPLISGVSNPEIRTTSRAPNHALLWNCVDQKCEVIDTLSGLTISGIPSMVSKGALFHQWLVLMKKIKSDAIPMIYSDAKRLAMDYQMAKLEVNKAFEKSGLGSWIIKPREQDEFDCSSVLQTNELNLSID